MRDRDTRPLYEQYLMDCIGRAQTLNLTFTIIAALRGGMCGGSRGMRRDDGMRAMLDVNFIIPAKKLRPGSSPNDRYSFCLRRLPLYRLSRVVSIVFLGFCLTFFFTAIILLFCLWTSFNLAELYQSHECAFFLRARLLKFWKLWIHFYEYGKLQVLL